MDNKIRVEGPERGTGVPCPKCGRELIRSVTDPSGTMLYCWYCDEEYKNNVGEAFGEKPEE